MNKSANKLFLVGVLGAVFSMFGDFLLSFSVYPEAENVFFALLASCKDISYIRLSLSALCGCIGIPLQYFGIEAIADLIKEKNERFYKIIHFGGVSTALFGGTVHLLCVLLMLVVKIECLNGFDPLASETILEMFPQSVLPFVYIAILPLSLICMVPYFVALMLIFVAVLKKQTAMPKWFCIINPITFVSVLQLIAIAFNPNVPFFNALNMGNKAIGAFFMFVVYYFYSKSKQRSAE